MRNFFFMFHCLSSVVGCCSLVSWKLTRSRECEKCDNLLIECGAILQGLSSRFTFYQRKINVENWFDNLQNISDTGSENACNRPELLLPTRMWWRERREIKILMYLIFFIPVLCEPKHNVSQNQIRNYPPPRISRNFVRNNHPSMSKFIQHSFDVQFTLSNCRNEMDSAFAREIFCECHQTTKHSSINHGMI